MWRYGGVSEDERRRHWVLRGKMIRRRRSDSLDQVFDSSRKQKKKNYRNAREFFFCFFPNRRIFDLSVSRSLPQTFPVPKADDSIGGGLSGRVKTRYRMDVDVGQQLESRSVPAQQQRLGCRNPPKSR